MKVSWLIEKRVILVNSDKELSLADFVQANKDVISHLDDGVSATHIIANFRDVVALPNTMYSLHKILTFVNHTNLDWEVFITNISFIRFLAKTINLTIGRRSFHMVKTYAEAKAFLQKQDPSLPDLPDSID